MEYSISDFKYEQKNACGNFILSIPSFHISKGELVFVYGSSGSGKSTFFNLLTGIKKSILSQTARKAFDRIEYVMHESKLLPWHKLCDNVKVINNLNGKIDYENLMSICRTLGLYEDILNMKSWQLSQGMRQRFEIAISLSNSPGLIIFDEAMSGIDNKNKEIVCSLVYKYIKQSNTTLIATAHQISDILRLAERVVCINNGTFTHDIPIVSYSVEERLMMSLEQLYTLPEVKSIMDAG
jgi:ABC-type multidrug transport system ATPase subunit